MQSDITLYCGAIVHAISAQRSQYIPLGALAVQRGRILFAGARTEAERAYPSAAVVDCTSAVLLPGCVDTHVHLPQWPIAGLAGGELLEWLYTRVFPEEERYADPSIAAVYSQRFFRDAIACGTTAMAVYCSAFYTAAHEAFRAAAASGIRAFIGRSLMDRGAPPALLSSAEQSIRESEQLATDWHGYDGGRLHYAVTPRFALSCTPELLRRCGEFARAEGLLLQTHLAENPQELAAVAAAFPECSSYADVYDKFGLLTERSLMAHCIYLSGYEQQLLYRRGCSIAHCPTSNRFLQSGVMPLRTYMNAGLAVALGSDVGAGYSLSLLHEAKEAIESTKTWNLFNTAHQQPVLTPEEALWLATLGGAEALGMSSRIGNFSPGKEADFVVVERPRYCTDTDTASDIIARVLYTAPRVLATYIRGRNVYIAANAVR